VVLGDLACFGSPSSLVRRRRRWSCPAGCGTWTERNDRIAAPRCSLTRRAGLWATTQVGQLARPVSQVAAELGVAWHTVTDGVVLYGTPLVADPERIGQVTPWRAGVRVAVCDLHEPFRAAFDAQLPHATEVADPFHVVAVGTIRGWSGVGLT
jgi:hypothetical protein